MRQAIEELSARVCVGLPVACGSLSDDAARRMAERIGGFQQAIGVFEDPGLIQPWQEALRRVAALPHVHGLVCGRCCRMLFDGGQLTADDVAARASQSFSPGVDAAAGAAWIEGFLENSGSTLLANEKLWGVVDSFVQELPSSVFQETLPLLRRTFSTFPAAERRQLGERVRADGAGGTRSMAKQHLVHQARAAKALPLLIRILGLEPDDHD
ncbi:MAG: DUF5682 family protein [Paludibaculum sp.]